MPRFRIVLAIALLGVSATLFAWSFSPATETVPGPNRKSSRQNMAALTGFASAPSSNVSGASYARRTPNVFTPAAFSGGNAGTAAYASLLAAQSAPDVAEEAPIDSSPKAGVMIKSRRSFDGDVRKIQHTPSRIRPERRELEGPEAGLSLPGDVAPVGSGLASVGISAPAPSTTANFEGLSYLEQCTGGQCGGGHPPDTNGDVGPTYYIQTVNTAIGIFNKSTGALVAGLTFDNFMSQGNFGNLCDTDNFGDPVVVYDTFTDRWIITDFAFQLDAQGNVIAPAYQCFAASKTGDPVAGGWNYYSVQISDLLGDYPKFGIWPDGLYMSANMFGFGANGTFKNVRAWAFNKAQMYAGAATVQSVSFDVAKVGSTSPFTLLPSNARVQTGTPPASTPNYYAGVYGVTNKVRIHKFHVDWTNTANSTFTGPFDSTTATSWSTLASSFEVPELNGNGLDTLSFRLMMQNQYSNIGGVESLWNSHTVAGSSNTQAVPRWYQVKVTGGTIEANATQAASWNPDSRNRWMPSVAVDRAGNMAIGYSVSDATIYPAIRYAGRLSTDPVNTLGQTETSLIEGGGSQTHVFSDGSLDNRWGDYSAMTLDPDGCTFWYTNEYYNTFVASPNGKDDHTRIGSFKFSQCTPLANGTLQGTVKTTGNAGISGASVIIGTDTAATDGSGFYSFASYPVGTYTVSATAPGYNANSANGVVVSANTTTTQNFTLTVAPPSACLTDTTQADFQAGTASNIDLTTSPGDVKLALGAAVLDQQQTTASTTGLTTTATTWVAQGFVPAITGMLNSVNVQAFFSSGTAGSLVMEIHNAVGSGASATPGTTVLATSGNVAASSASATTYAFTFSSPPALSAGTTYFMVVHDATGTTATYGTIVACKLSPGCNPYTTGTAYNNTSSGSGSWTAISSDLFFQTMMQAGYASSGNLVSSLKDANPDASSTATWATLAWTNPALPSGTNLQFQVASSNSPSGPFNFVGPDSTSGTFFSTSGASLSQFNGNRYLKYKAYLSTSNASNTPTLNDVTACYNNAAPAATSLAASSATGTYGGTTNLSATLTSGGNGVSGKTVSFNLDGSPVGTATTNASGVASLSNVSLSGIGAGTYPNAVAASFPGDGTYATSGGTNSLTVSKANQSITVSAHAPASAVYSSQFTVAATAGSSLAVAYSSSGVCNNSGATYTMTGGTGTCSVIYDQSGDTNYNAAIQVSESVTASKAAQAITFNALTNKTFGDPDFSVSATASSGLSVSFVASGQCTATGNSVHLTGAGSCTITASQSGDSNFSAADDVPRSFTVAKANQTITVGTHAPSTATYNSQFTVAATASSALPVSYSSSGSCTNVGATYTMTSATGTCTVNYDQAGNTNYNAATQVTESVNASKASQTITFGALADKTYGDPDFILSATASSGLSVSFAASGQCTVTGSSVHLTGAGSCTITASQAGDSNYDAATSVDQIFGIAKASSATAISSSANPSDLGDGVTFTATVASPAGTPSGTVQFKDGANNIGAAVSLVGGQGQASISSLTAGTHTITAEYSGDGNFGISTGTLSGGQVVHSAQIAVEQPPGSDLISGTSTVDFGGVAPNANNARTFTIRNDGSADLTGLQVTFDGTNATEFTVTSAPTAPVTPGGTTSLTVQFAPSASGARSAVLHIASNDPNNSSFNTGLSGTGYTYSEAWRTHYFGSPDNTGDGADLNDYDKDGLTNLLEFATASDPTQPNNAPGTIAQNGNVLELTYTRSVGAMIDGIVFNVEWSDDLSLLSWSNSGVTEVIISDDGNIQIVKASVSAGPGSSRFLRLKVTRP
jgi:hypothetical protein